MKKLSAILLLLMCSYFTHAQKLPPFNADPNGYHSLDSLFNHMGQNKTFFGRIYGLSVLGDSVVVLVAGEFKRSNKSFNVWIRDKKMAKSPYLSVYTGLSITTIGSLVIYNEQPTLIVGDNSTNRIAVIDNRPRTTAKSQ